MGNQRKIGGTQLFAQLQDGPITDVYKGYQESLLRQVLVKVLRPEYESDDQLVKRFLNEARGSARIQHPNVVAIYEHGESEGRHYFVSEYVDGCDLEHLLLRHSLPPELAWYILSEVTKGLQAAHQNGVVHRDLKSSNILISNAGEVKLADFGMSDLSASVVGDTDKEMKGTEHYLAPEVVLGEQVGPWSDIFSLGITFYEMLAGVKPFRGDASRSLFKSIVEEDPIPYLHSIPSLPDPLITLCAGMLGKYPESRFKTCEELLIQLLEIRVESGFEVSQKRLAAYLESPAAYRAFSFTSSAVILPQRKRTHFYLSTVALVAVALFAWQLGLMSRNDNDMGPIQHMSPDMVELRKEPSAELSGIIEEEKPRGSPSVVQPPVGSGKKEFGDIDKNVAAKGFSIVESATVGWLDIDCSPWASVFIGGDSIGTTPLSGKLTLKAGVYQIELKNPEFPIVRETIHVSPDSTTRINISLLKLVASLTLDIHPWAEVYIDGEYKDTLPPQKRPFFLSQGEHLLQLKHPTLGQWQTSIQLHAGEELECRYNLMKLLKK
jgi:serine/threonine-protein kinase